MEYISDDEAQKLAKKVLSADEYEHFAHALERMRHFDECLAANTPSPRCKHTDPVKNLEWCRLGFKIEGINFEHWLGEVLHRAGV